MSVALPRGLYTLAPRLSEHGWYPQFSSICVRIFHEIYHPAIGVPPLVETPILYSDAEEKLNAIDLPHCMKLGAFLLISPMKLIMIGSAPILKLAIDLVIAGQIPVCTGYPPLLRSASKCQSETFFLDSPKLMNPRLFQETHLQKTRSWIASAKLTYLWKNIIFNG